jgi:hypothetical protein
LYTEIKKYDKLYLKWRVKLNFLKKQINQVIDDIGETTVLLYQQKSNQGYAKLGDLINSIITVTDEIFKYRQEHNIPTGDQKLINALTIAMNAMEDKDYVLLADILIYEIAEQLREFENLIN